MKLVCKMRFGMHKGKYFDQIPLDYLQWALRTCQDLDWLERDEMNAILRKAKHKKRGTQAKRQQTKEQRWFALENLFASLDLAEVKAHLMARGFMGLSGSAAAMAYRQGLVRFRGDIEQWNRPKFLTLIRRASRSTQDHKNRLATYLSTTNETPEIPATTN